MLRSVSQQCFRLSDKPGFQHLPKIMRAHLFGLGTQASDSKATEFAPRPQLQRRPSDPDTANRIHAQTGNGVAARFLFSNNLTDPIGFCFDKVGNLSIRQLQRHKMRIWEPLVTLNSIDRRRDDRRTETG